MVNDNCNFSVLVGELKLVEWVMSALLTHFQAGPFGRLPGHLITTLHHLGYDAAESTIFFGIFSLKGRTSKKKAAFFRTFSKWGGGSNMNPKVVRYFFVVAFFVSKTGF